MRSRNYLRNYDQVDYAMVRQAHHELNQHLTVRPEPVEGLNQSFFRDNNKVVLIISI